MAVRALLIAILAVSVGCERADHPTIEKWQTTAKGATKLARALADESLDPDLSAHAAVTLIRRGEDRAAFAALEAMAPGRRADVVAKMAPRLWDVARVEHEADRPGSMQVVAKDGLVRIRGWAGDAARAQIDGYLIDWFCVQSYPARAVTGLQLGAPVMRMVGPAAAPRLAKVVNAVIAEPGQAQVRNRIDRELMLGLAATGSAEAVAYLLDLARMDRGDDTQAARAIGALYTAYVDPNGAFAAAIAAIAADDRQPAEVANDAVALLRAIGPPSCLPALIGMIGAPHRNPDFKLVAANNALKCGGVQAIRQVVVALPDAGVYVRDKLTRRVSGEIARMTPREAVVAAARALLAERSVVARWVAIEALAELKSVEDAPRIAALATSRDRLMGYWGEDAVGKTDPTLGQRAKELSAALGGK
jgi:hypothetical protein